MTKAVGHQFIPEIFYNWVYDRRRERIILMTVVTLEWSLQID